MPPFDYLCRHERHIGFAAAAGAAHRQAPLRYGVELQRRLQPIHTHILYNLGRGRGADARPCHAPQGRAHVRHPGLHHPRLPLPGRVRALLRPSLQRVGPLCARGLGPARRDQCRCRRPAQHRAAARTVSRHGADADRPSHIRRHPLYSRPHRPQQEPSPVGPHGVARTHLPAAVEIHPRGRAQDLHQRRAHPRGARHHQGRHQTTLGSTPSPPPSASPRIISYASSVASSTPPPRAT